VVVATAGVQYVNGGANWGYDYYEDGVDLAQFYGPWLLSVNAVGGGEHNCQWFCEPEGWMVSSCEAMSDPEFTYYWDYNVCSCVSNSSPIIIDMKRDGLSLTNPVDGVSYDLLANGTPVQTAWTKAGGDDAFLVLDRNGNGLIDDGSELFGNKTDQPEPVTKKKRKKQSTPNGFLALAVFDEAANGGNGDHVITDADTIYPRLRLWTDRNHNGVSEATELTPLSDAGIRALSLRYVASKKTDEHGNIFRFWSTVITDRDLDSGQPLKRRAVDVFLQFIGDGAPALQAAQNASATRRIL
jgi:hypothetical protein